MTNAAYIVGAPVNFHDKFKIYPPLVKDVAANENFGLYLKMLTFSQEEIEDELVNKIEDDAFPTPFEFLLNNAYHNKQFEQLARDAFKFFIHSPVTFLYEKKAVIIGNLEQLLPNLKSVNDLILFTEDEFFDFQNEIRKSMGEKPIDPPNPNEDPRIKRIKAKARYRDKIKAKKGMGINLSTSLVAIFCMGLGITPLNIGEMSYVSVMSIMRTYQEKEKYDIDIRSLLAGADSKKIKPKYWIRNLDE